MCLLQAHQRIKESKIATEHSMWPCDVLLPWLHRHPSTRGSWTRRPCPCTSSLTFSWTRRSILGSVWLMKRPETDLRLIYERKMKIQSFRQVCAGQTDTRTDRHTDRLTPWAPDGAKNCWWFHFPLCQKYTIFTTLENSMAFILWIEIPMLKNFFELYKNKWVEKIRRNEAVVNLSHLIEATAESSFQFWFQTVYLMPTIFVRFTSKTQGSTKWTDLFQWRIISILIRVKGRSQK